MTLLERGVKCGRFYVILAFIRELSLFTVIDVLDAEGLLNDAWKKDLLR